MYCPRWMRMTRVRAEALMNACSGGIDAVFYEHGSWKLTYLVL